MRWMAVGVMAVLLGGCVHAQPPALDKQDVKVALSPAVTSDLQMALNGGAQHFTLAPRLLSIVTSD